MDNRNYKTDLATFIKVALVAAVVITIVKTDIEAQMSFTKLQREQIYKSAEK